MGFHWQRRLYPLGAAFSTRIARLTVCQRRSDWVVTKRSKFLERDAAVSESAFRACGMADGQIAFEQQAAKSDEGALDEIMERRKELFHRILLEGDEYNAHQPARG